MKLVFGSAYKTGDQNTPAFPVNAFSAAFLISDPDYFFGIYHDEAFFMGVESGSFARDPLPPTRNQVVATLETCVSPGERHFYHDLFDTPPSLTQTGAAPVEQLFVSPDKTYPFLRVLSFRVDARNTVLFVAKNETRPTNGVLHGPALGKFVQLLGKWVVEYDYEKGVGVFESALFSANESKIWPDLEIVRFKTTEDGSTLEKVHRASGAVYTGSFTAPPVPERRLNFWWPSAPSSGQNQTLISALFAEDADSRLSGALLDMIQVYFGLYLGGLQQIAWARLPYAAVRRQKSIVGRISEHIRKAGVTAADLPFVSPALEPYHAWLPEFKAFHMSMQEEVRQRIGRETPPIERSSQGRPIEIPFEGARQHMGTILPRIRSNDFCLVDPEADTGMIFLRECTTTPRENTVWTYLVAKGIKTGEPKVVSGG